MATGTGNLPNPAMSFSPFAILTAEELNDLVDNIESLATGAGIGDGAVLANRLVPDAVEHGYVQIASGSNSGQTSLSVTSIPEFDRLRVLVRFAPSGALIPTLRFNNDTGNNYSYSHKNNDDSVISANSQSAIQIGPTTGVANWWFTYDIYNLPGIIKSISGSGISGVSGVSNPGIRSNVGVWSNTSVRITRIDLIASANNLGAASMIVLGLNEA